MLLLFLLSSLIAAGQDKGLIKVGFLSGFDVSGQPGLSDRNQYNIKNMPFEVRIIDDFVPHPVFGSFFQYSFTDRLNIGPEYSYHYTGSRIGARDYSAVYSFDQYVKSDEAGIKIDYYVKKWNRSSFLLDINTGLGFTRWKMETYFGLLANPETAEKNLMSVKGISWYIRPALAYQLTLLHFDLTGSVCYSFESFENFKYQDEVIKNGLPTCEGFCILIGIDYSFRFFQRETKTD